VFPRIAILRNLSQFRVLVSSYFFGEEENEPRSGLLCHRTFWA